MENNNTGKIIMAFFMVIVGVVLIATISNNSAAVTDKINIVNETVSIASARNLSGTTFALNYSVDISVTNAPTGWKSTDCPLGSFSMVNQSGTAMTDTTDYDVDESTGTLNFLNTLIANMSGTSNTTYASYTYCSDDYLNSAWGRSVMNLIAGFFALALLGIGLTLFYGILRDNGVIGK